MRVPLSWLREHAAVPAEVPAREVADALLRAGLEVETVERVGQDLLGPLVVGEVLAFEDEEHANGRTVRWCQVAVGTEGARGIVCGARNFAVGDRVVVALPGAVLPGGFAIGTRRTYGHVSDGMICSARELGIGDDHAGILVLDDRPDVGTDAIDLLALREDVLDIAVTPDRGYCLSVRGVAREAATAFGVPFRDPADVPVPAAGGEGWPVGIDDPDRCGRFVARTVTGFDPGAPSPRWLQRRVQLGGMRPVSLAVDVTNFVMLELGHPLHAYDRDRLRGRIVVRRARGGESLRTLDGAQRDLDPDDLLITDGSGPIGIAGVMGGEATEISATSTDIVLEAAHFEPRSIARSARRHRLPSEASRRFERGVDPLLGPAAAERAARLLVEIGGGAVAAGATDVGTPPLPSAIDVAEATFERVIGWGDGDVAEAAAEPSSAADDTPVDVVGYLRAVGCTVTDVEPEWTAYTPLSDEIYVPDHGILRVTPPSWRPDLTDPYDLVEEVARLHGYAAIPSRLPVPPPGRGLTGAQRLRRRLGRALAAAGYVEAPTYPFVSPAVWDGLGLPDDDPRRRALRVANPLSDEQPQLRTTLLPGLLATLRRNVGRGAGDVALFELGQVFLPRPGQPDRAPRLGVDRRPAPAELAAQEAALPEQPQRLAAVLAGSRERSGWWGPGRPATWADAVQTARDVAREAGVEVAARADERMPWHPGRCAALLLGGEVVGHAGELHPRVVTALGLPARTAALEIDADALTAASLARGLLPAPLVPTYPVATRDVALVVDDGVPAADVEGALRDGAGPLLEELRLFDVFTGGQVGQGRRSLAYALRLRAPDRTLTAEEASAARDAAVAEAAKRTGAVLRGA